MFTNFAYSTLEYQPVPFEKISSDGDKIIRCLHLQVIIVPLTAIQIWSMFLRLLSARKN
jgi:hypothetical protein